MRIPDRSPGPVRWTLSGSSGSRGSTSRAEDAEITRRSQLSPLGAPNGEVWVRGTTWNPSLQTRPLRDPVLPTLVGRDTPWDGAIVAGGRAALPDA